mgnify:CR=1 FL=1
MTDVEIAKSIPIKNINEIATSLGISEGIEPYGNYKAKIANNAIKNLENKDKGKLVLITSINPTPLGEGKTTIAIGLADALRKIGKKSILALREPSLGPVFGIKGGATGGGYAQVAPMDEINLHFTGDIHAITTANNLLSALIDNHIYHGNELKIKEVTWKRCLDMNDRALRCVEIGLNDKKALPRKDGFDISVASEIMAIFCLSKDLKDLKRRLGNIIIGYNESDKPITAKDLKADGAMLALLKEAFKPNLVQTLEHTPAIIHGGPFANIAHGCNSIVATNTALSLGDYVITEAGFGADLGAEKFIDIKSRIADIKPDVAVCVATIKALKYHGGVSREEVSIPNIEALKVGIENLLKHVQNLKEVFGLNTIVAINRYKQDTKEEIEILINAMKEKNIPISLAEVWEKGGNGAIELAEKVAKLAEKESYIHYAYLLDDNITEKIEKIATKIYGATGVEYTNESLEKIKKIENMGYTNLPVCIAKTQYSLSDDANNLECKEPFKIHIKDVILKAGAEFIVVLTGNIFTMPGLPKTPAAEKIDLDADENIIGIF